jgi:hypothetical protein
MNRLVLLLFLIPTFAFADAWVDAVASGSTDGSAPVADGLVQGSPITTVTGGSCTKLRVYLNFVNATTQMKCALFDASGNALGSGVATPAGDAQYTEFTLSSPVTVTSTTTYIVGYMANGGPGGEQGAWLTGQPSGSRKVNFTEVYATFPSAFVSFSPDTQLNAVGMFIVSSATPTPTPGTRNMFFMFP